jgi:hypothetical protein
MAKSTSQEILGVIEICLVFKCEYSFLRTLEEVLNSKDSKKA